jgi:inhibitor of KinA sporulation pathway (predicted exonuclease)
MSATENYVVIDLEATCTNSNEFPREQTEIIEIGAVLVDGKSLEPISEFQTFVKPVRHPVLTSFCTRLTTIQQEDVEHAPRFPQALGELRSFIAGKDSVFCSWGAYDKNQFEQDARFHGVVLPFGPRHLNLKKMFSAELRESRPYGAGQAIRRVGLTFEGTPHRGIDDARNIARLLPWILGRKRVGRT